MSLLWVKVASFEHEPGEGCPGGLDQYDHHKCGENVTHIWHQGYGVMALRHTSPYSGKSSTMLFASHRPGGPDTAGESIGEGNIDDNVVQNVGVSREHQRKGVSKLWGAAVKHLQERGEHPPVVASAERTDKGDAAARALGLESEGPRKVVYKSEMP